MLKISFVRCCVPILLLSFHSTASFLQLSPTDIKENPIEKEKGRNAEIVKSSYAFSNVDIDASVFSEWDDIRYSNKIKIEDPANTFRHEKNNSLWSISAPVKRSTEREKPKLSCSWHPENSSLVCQLMNFWHHIKNEIDEIGKVSSNEIKVSKVNFGSISSRHQRESTKTLSLDCGLPSEGVSNKETKEKTTRYVQLFGFGGLGGHHKRDGYHYNYYDGDSRRRKNKSNRNGKHAIQHWPQLTKVQVINCPLITSTAAVKKQYNIGDKNGNQKSLLTSLFQSIFGSVNIPIASVASPINELDLSNNGIKKASLFTDKSVGNNKRLPRKLLSLECKAFGNRLEILNLSDNELTLISDVFNGNDDFPCAKGTFVNLHELRLSHNRISRLLRDDLNFAPYLERLYLKENKIRSIEDAFRIPSQMKVIDLSHNQISFLPVDFFSYGLNPRKNETLQLTEIHLQNNSLREIPSFQSHRHSEGGLVILPHLVLLNLSRNAIVWNDSSFNKQLSPFEGMPNLVALDLSHNEITSLTDHLFKGLESLQVLTLAYNKIASMSTMSLHPLHNLHALVLSHNLIGNEMNGFVGYGRQDQVTSALKGKNKLRSLSLDHNRIQHIGRETFEDCTAVQDLTLEANQISDLPDERTFTPMVNTLKTLDLGENEIVQFPDGILSGLKKLFGLRLAGNRLRNLTSLTFKGAENIRMLNLASNTLETIDQNCFSSLKHLKALRLDNNSLTDINGLLTTQNHLQWLNVSYNLIQWFDYAFVPKSVLWLNMRANSIEELGNYYEMTGFQLVHLDIGQNKLIRLDKQALQNSLREILIDHNDLVELAPYTFTNLANLSMVNLTNNKLTKFPLNALTLDTSKTLSSDKSTLDMIKTNNGHAEVLLGDNPLKCDCEMEWLQRYNSELSKSVPRKFPIIGDWSKLKCSLNNRQGDIIKPRDQSNNNSATSKMFHVTEIQPQEYLCPYETHCFALCMCCDFFACDCRMKCSEGCDCYHDQTWSNNIIACGKRGHQSVPKFIPMDATSVYLDGNDLSGTNVLNDDLFIGRKQLNSLYLNSSHVVSISNKTFNGLSELVSLHLEHNVLATLTGGEFTELTSLEQLYLHHNKLVYISTNTFSSLDKLRTLTLHDNLLTTYPVWNLFESVRINELSLAGNKWTCKCEFVKKLQSTMEKYESRTKVVDASSLKCSADDDDRIAQWSTIGKLNLSCTDVLAISYVGNSQPGDIKELTPGEILDDLVPIIAVVSASIVIVVSLIILAVALRRPVTGWLRNNRSRLEGKPITPFTLGNTIPSINPTTANAQCVVGGGSSTSSSSASQGTTNLSGSHSLSTAGSSMVTNSLVNQAQQRYSILIHYSLSDKTFVLDTLAPKMISDLTPSEESSTLLLQSEKKRQICFQQQTDTKLRSDGKSIERNLMNSESVIVVASEHYMKINNNSNELKTITERVCTGPNKKPLVVIALESSTAQTLRHTTSLKASNILVWGSPNFWQNVSRNLMTKYQTFNNNKLHNLSLSSPNKKKEIMGSDDDEMWTYLKTNSDSSNNGKNGEFILSDNNTNRLSMGTLKENLNTRGYQNDLEDKSYNFNFPSSTLQLGKRKQYLRGNPIPSSTPTSRRTSHPDSTETTSSLSSKSRSPNTSKVESHHSMLPSRNILENPFESHKPERFAYRKPPPYPTSQNHAGNSNSDSDYMSVNDSLAPKNEPIYHTLDDEQYQQRKSFNKPVGHSDPNDDQKVYINSALEVVYPTESLLRRQQQKLLELQRQHDYLKQKQRDYQSFGLENEELDDENEVDEEFDELLGNNLEDGYTDEDQEDVYENGDDNSISYYRHGMLGIERKPSSASTNYVPSPAPGTNPRNRSDRDLNGFIAMRDPYDNLFLGGSNASRRALYDSQKGVKKGHKKGNYFV